VTSNIVIVAVDYIQQSIYLIRDRRLLLDYYLLSINFRL
jgi:hypothetical protein